MSSESEMEQPLLFHELVDMDVDDECEDGLDGDHRAFDEGDADGEEWVEQNKQADVELELRQMEDVNRYVRYFYFFELLLLSSRDLLLLLME